MIVYLDTSSLLKLYHREAGSEELIDILKKSKATKLYLSDLTKLEFSSAIWKKIRMKEIEEEQGIRILDFFKTDWNKYFWIKIDNSIVAMANDCLKKYGRDGLRTLDSIQLATALFIEKVNNEEKLFLTADNILKKIFEFENIKYA